MTPAPSRFKRFAGYAFIAAIWGLLLVLLAFFGAAYAIYRDMRDSAHSHLTRGTAAEVIAHDISIHFRSPIDSLPDDQLWYVPRPGKDRVTTPEYDVVVTTTNDSVRSQPPFPSAAGRPVVMIGDSFTLGLGVDDDQTYSCLLQQRYGYPTVNTGVASYAAARELTRARRLGLLAPAALLIVQFCSNDARENHDFLAHPLAPFPHADPNVERVNKEKFEFKFARLTYLNVINASVRHLRYRLQGSGLKATLKFFATGHLASLREPIVQRGNPSGRQLAQDFLHVLDLFPEIAHTPILVVELNERGGTTGFLPALAELARDRPNLTPLPIDFKESDFYRFDGHLTPEGHRVVAAALDRAIRKLHLPDLPGRSPTPRS